MAEGIIQVIDDAEMAARMGQIGRQRLANELSWEMQVPKLLAAYERTLAKGRSRSAGILGRS